MAYNHGVRVQEQETSIVAPITGTAGLQVVIGTAPVNLAADPYAVTNVPIIAYSYKEAVQQLGYSDDFKKYTLCQSIDASFRVLNVAPIILINVLDPKKHKKANEEVKVAVESMQAVVEITGILADTVENFYKKFYGFSPAPVITEERKQFLDKCLDMQRTVGPVTKGSALHVYGGNERRE